jgi:hypothetical protein
MILYIFKICQNIVLITYCNDFRLCDYRDGVLYSVIGFIDHLYTPLGTIGNYSAIADLSTLQFTVTHTYTH